jgi:uncharacterized coiled-coil DUF342 family protein
MSGKKDYNYSNYLNEAQKKVKEFMLERNQLNSNLKNYILSFQSFDFEIYNSLFEAREFYTEKRYNYKIEIEKLRRKRFESERLWKNLTKKMKALPKPKLNNNILVSIDYTKRSLEDIEYKVNNMNKKLEEFVLDIEEENEIIEKLKELEINKQNKMKILIELEQKQTNKLQSSDYYLTKRRIEPLERNLQEIYENLIILSYKRLMTHKKMLDLYRKVKEFEKIKKEIENELIANKISADRYHQLFLNLMNQNKKVLLDSLLNKPKRIMRPREIKTPNVGAIIKKKKKYKRLEQKRLAIALDKQKAGKRLDFYELKLILKHSKNKKV